MFDRTVGSKVAGRPPGNDHGSRASRWHHRLGLGAFLRVGPMCILLAAIAAGLWSAAPPERSPHPTKDAGQQHPPASSARIVLRTSLDSVDVTSLPEGLRVEAIHCTNETTGVAAGTPAERAMTAQVASASDMSMWGPWITEIRVLLPGDMRPETGHAFGVTLDIPLRESDGPFARRRSRWVLFEDDVALGPAHAEHVEIREQGGGRYSHWKERILFATSDNSDPRVNGRRYALGRLDSGSMRRLRDEDAILIAEAPVLLSGAELNGGRTFATGEPHYSPERPAVNPQPVLSTPFGLLLATPGEYYIESGRVHRRVLVLPSRAATSPRTASDRTRVEAIAAFVAANVRGGISSEDAIWAPQADGRSMATGRVVDRRLGNRLFRDTGSLDVACGTASRLAWQAFTQAGFVTRYVHWLGTDAAFNAHLALEVWLPDEAQWRLVDVHFGLIAIEPASALDITLALASGDEASPVVLGLLVDKGSWSREHLVGGLTSLARGALGIDSGRGESRVYLRQAPPTETLAAPRPPGSREIMGSEGLRYMRERLYAPPPPRTVRDDSSVPTAASGQPLRPSAGSATGAGAGAAVEDSASPVTGASSCERHAWVRGADMIALASRGRLPMWKASSADFPFHMRPVLLPVVG